ncbi:MAG TPA: prolyl oligopeptidase family serine peptidase [Thermoanaerobaculia bacterium]|nr:prolyl oligopeptidase family serine peptidase [Thermoanaerobaculia bacterium]
MNVTDTVFRFATALVAVTAFHCATARPAETGFLNRSVTHDATRQRYVVYVPDVVDGHRPPVVLFLHGSGERGDDGLRQIEVGLGRAIRWHRERFPMIVVFPQAPPDTRWLGDEARFAMQALDRSIAEFGGDPDRVYLTGLSLGGYGTWHLAMQHPDRFAALVPVCGGIVKPESAQNVRQSPLTIGADDPYSTAAEKVKHIPIWIFHGADDTLIPPSESRRMHDELRRLGADVRYTEYPGVGHNSWDLAYGDPDLWNWLLRQRR